MHRKLALLLLLLSILFLTGCTLSGNSEEADFTSEVGCMEACRRSSYQQGICKWADEDEFAGTKLGTCQIQSSIHCNTSNECNCFCYTPITTQVNPPQQPIQPVQPQNNPPEEPERKDQEQNNEDQEKDESLSREITPAEEIKVLFANQYKIQIDQIDLKITQFTDAYARGLVQILADLPDAPKGVFTFFAQHTEEGWQIAFAGNQPIPCDQLIQSGFPEIMLAECTTKDQNQIETAP